MTDYTNDYSAKFTSNMRLQFQANRFSLSDKVTFGNYAGDSLAQIETVVESRNAVSNTDFLAETPIADTSRTQRWITAGSHEVPADLLANEDQIRMAIKPESEYVATHAAAMNRKKDEVVLSCMFANARTGVQGGTNTAFPSANTIAANVGTNAGLNIAKLKAVKTLASKKYIGDLPLFIAVTPEAKAQLLSEEKLTSTDYQPDMPLKTFTLPNAMGLYFVEFNLGDYAMFPDLEAYFGTASARNLPVWTPSAIQFGMWSEAATTIDKRPDKKNAWQIYTKGTFGASRRTENGVFKIIIDETV